MPRKPLQFKLTRDEVDKIYYHLNDIESDSEFVKRCLIILMTENGVHLKAIANLLKISKTTANRWRQAFLSDRWEALKRKKVGRPQKQLEQSTRKYSKTKITSSPLKTVHNVKIRKRVYMTKSEIYKSGEEKEPSL
ncbi:MAG: helix-turn-helix domain-containing protein [Geobacteraceae bacterium]